MFHSRRSSPSDVRRDVIVHLRDDAGHELKRWTFRNARPLKVIAPDGKDEYETAIESIVLEFEGMTEE